MTPTIRYPAGPITKHGAYYLLHDTKIPLVKYRSYDDNVVFSMMGGDAIPNRDQPETVILKGLKGLIPPWQTIKQKGASQDGSTYVTSLYDELEVELSVRIQGRDPAHRRQVLRDWVDSWDAKRPGELSWYTPEMGRWWAPVRFSKPPVDAMSGPFLRAQDFTWPAIAHDAFWRSYDSTGQYGLGYAAGTGSTETFDYNTNPGLSDEWDLGYTGTGTGWIYAQNSFELSGNTLGLPEGGMALWYTDSGILTAGRDVACRRNDFVSTTDNQVVRIQLGNFEGFSFPPSAGNYIWARMNNSGTAGTDGVRLCINDSWLTLESIKGGSAVATIARVAITVPPIPGEWWQLSAGFSDNDRLYRAYRNGVQVMACVESAGSSVSSYIDSSHRRAGFGMHAGEEGLGALGHPASVLTWGAGDNSAADHSGFIERCNTGDQPMWDRFTLFGPGYFWLGDGPNAKQSVGFGPLLDNQVVQIRTDPRKRGVVDLSTVPAPPQQLHAWQQAIKDFVSFATAGNVPPLLQALENLAGIVAPQGNLYSLMSGRFSTPIPPKPAGLPATVCRIPVRIDGGDSASRIVAAGTPLRRFPF